MQISIAGYLFKFVPEDIVLRDTGEKHWLSGNYTLSGDLSAVHTEIEVRITPEKLPDYSGLNRFFDSGESWTGYKAGNVYYIVDHHPSLDSPAMVSVLQPDKRSVTIYCSDFIVQKLENGDFLHPFSYPLDQVILSFFLADNMGGIIHSSGWLHDGQALLFPGVSGAGKSTIARLIKSATGEAFLSDDRVVLSKHGSQIMASGTPWAGEEGDALNMSAPLLGLFFIEKGTANSIKSLSPIESIRRLMPVLTVPWYDEVRVIKMMDFCDHLLRSVPVFSLTFTKNTALIDQLLAFLCNNFKE